MALEKSFDLAKSAVRELNQFLHHELPASSVKHIDVLNPGGLHSIAVGINHPVDIDVRGHGGYYVGGMNKFANITVHGNVGWGVAENMMSGSVRVKGFASESAGATGHGGLLVIEGDASLRCGISMKGIDIVVGGGVGNYSAFMAQAGRLVVCGDAGDALGDSLYEAVLYVRGKIKSLGADAHVEDMTEADYLAVGELLERAGFTYDPTEFKRVASMRSLYHWNADADQEY
jgi:glutamate synthase domain-containing protein 3